MIGNLFLVFYCAMAKGVLFKYNF